MIKISRKRKNLDKPGQILMVRALIAKDCTAEIVPEPGGKHLAELKAGETHNLPVWSAMDLIARGLASQA